MPETSIGLLAGGVELVLSLVLALIATYGAFRIADLLIRRVDCVEELRRKNVAVGILFAAILLASALIVREVTGPAVSTLKTVLYQGPTVGSVLRGTVLVIGFGVLAMIAAVLSTWVAMRCFLALTRNLDEIEEIRSGNVAVALTLGVAIVVFGLFLATGLGGLLNALIPYPAVVPIEVIGG